jgi:hypothetical protein
VNYCKSCEVGRYQSNEGRWFCNRCEKGRYSSSVESLTCTICGKGRVAPRTGMTQCRYCRLGTYNDDGTTNEGTDVTLHDSLEDCTACDAGKLSESTFDACYVCPGGTYVFNNSACVDCAMGKYAPTAVNNDCIACDIGFFTGTPTAATVCTACDAGTYSWGLAVNCTDCLAGKYSLTRSGNCTRCAPGFITPDEKSSSCTACDVGTYAPDLASIACTACPAGKAQGATGQGYCDVCARGTYMASSGATFCASCDAGTYQPKNGSQSCIDCIPGRFQSATAQVACTLCEAGKALNESRGSTCTACSDVSSSLPGSITCEICNRNYFLSANKQELRKTDPDVEVCVLCQEDFAGIDCGKAGASVDSMRLKEGFWRTTELVRDDAVDDADGDADDSRRRLSENKFPEYSEDIKSCPFKRACVGGNGTQTHSDGTGPYCFPGSTGPYCLVCIDNFQPDTSNPGLCIECESINMASVILGGTLFVGACVALVLFRKYIKVNEDGVLEWRVKEKIAPAKDETTTPGGVAASTSRQTGDGRSDGAAAASGNPSATSATMFPSEIVELDQEEEEKKKKKKEKAVDFQTVAKILFGKSARPSDHRAETFDH